MRFEPAYRHPSAFALAAGLLLLPTFAVVALSLLGHELGLGAVAAVTDPGSPGSTRCGRSISPS